MATAAIEQPEVTEQQTKPADPLAERTDLQSALKQIIQKIFDYDRALWRSEIMAARLQRFYWRGEQYIYWNESVGAYFTSSNGQGQIMIGSTAIDMPKYTDVYNMFTPYGRAIIAAFTQNSPGIRFQAKDPKDGSDLTAKAEAEKYRHYFDRANDNKQLQQDMARLYWTDTRTVTWTRWDKDEEREIAGAFGTLETKVPFNATKVKEWPYAVIMKEQPLVTLKEDFPDQEKKIEAGKAGFSDDFARTARLGILATGRSFPAGDASRHMGTRYTVWLRPSMYREAAKEKSSSVADELRQMFPDGVRCTFVGDVYCEAVSESLDEHLAVSFPLPGDGMSRPSMGSSIVGVQDTINDECNLIKETFDYTQPQTFINATPIDLEALREQISQPGNYVGLKKPAGEAMVDQIYREQQSEVSETLLKFLEMLWGNMAQFMTGALPALFGGADADNQTRGGIAMMREQALGQMSLPWGSMQKHFARIYEQAVRIAGKNREGQSVNVEVPDGKQAKRDTLDFGSLDSGEVLCFADTDSSFPETYSAKRGATMEFLKALGPAAMSLLDDPNNQEAILDLAGNEDLVSPGQQACEKQRRETEQLLQESPVPDEQAYQSALAQWKQLGMAAQLSQTPFDLPEPQQEEFMKSSVEIDPDYDSHKYHFAEVQREIESLDGDQQKQNNPEGFMNLHLHGLAHKKAMEAAAMPPPGTVPPPKQTGAAA